MIEYRRHISGTRSHIGYKIIYINPKARITKIATNQQTNTPCATPISVKLRTTSQSKLTFRRGETRVLQNTDDGGLKAIE